MSFKMVLRIWVIVFALAAYGSGLNLDITPNVYKHSIGGSVQLNCTTEGEDIFAVQASVLRISRNDGKVIGRVDKDQHVTIGDVTDETLQIEGHIAGPDEKVASYLAVKITNPNCVDSGTYTCIKVADSSAGDLSSTKTKATLTVDKKSINNHVDFLQKHLETVNDNVSVIKYKVGELRRLKGKEVNAYKPISKADYRIYVPFNVNPHQRIVVKNYKTTITPSAWMNPKTGMYTTQIAGFFKMQFVRNDSGASKWFLCRNGRQAMKMELVNWNLFQTAHVKTEYWMLDEGESVWLEVEALDKVVTVKEVKLEVVMFD